MFPLFVSHGMQEGTRQISARESTWIAFLRFMEQQANVGNAGLVHARVLAALTSRGFVLPAPGVTRVGSATVYQIELPDVQAADVLHAAGLRA